MHQINSVGVIIVESSEETLKTCIIDLLVNTKKIVRGSRPLPISMKKQPSCELRAGAISMDPLQSRIGCSYSFMSDRPRSQLGPQHTPTMEMDVVGHKPILY